MDHAYRLHEFELGQAFDSAERGRGAGPSAVTTGSVAATPSAANATTEIVTATPSRRL
jgi:hypothetical protein